MSFLPRSASIILCTLALVTSPLFAVIEPMPDGHPGIIVDRQDFQIPDRVQLSGFLGQRVLGNETERLVRIDIDRLLEGYRKRPGRQAWDGEHVGKWLHAATLAWVNTGDPALRAKMDYTVRELAKCQLADGYLGTYAESERWTEWDVWAHKYNLLGLLTYIRYTGDTTPLATCRRMADMLCSQLGDGPAQRDILKAGDQHTGMASTSVLEPMVLLYRFTGEQRYLDFCQYILRSWEKPHGPHILSTLLGGKGVNSVGNAKAYEMLSCLNGALELYRTTGDKSLLKACQQAWQDIGANRLYITGTASAREHFRGDHELERANNTGETCVTVTWLQFNSQLLRLTGEVQFAEEIERTVLNQLLGAQRPDCKAWGYYVEMEGRKPYSDTFDGHCCLSSGPRGLALVPGFALTTDDDGVVVNLFDTGRAALRLRDGTQVSVRLQTMYPAQGGIHIEIDSERPLDFAVKLRIPAWARGAKLSVNGLAQDSTAVPGRYATVRRLWKKGDLIDLELPVAPRLVMGTYSDHGRAALCYGPLVMALDEASLEGSGQTTATVNWASSNQSFETVFEKTGSGSGTAGGLAIQGQLMTRKRTNGIEDGKTIKALWRPFAQAGSEGSAYQVWVKLPATGDENLLPYGEPFGSDPKVATMAINDEKPATKVELVQSIEGTEIWFAVRLQHPADLKRFVYRNGYGLWVPGNYFVPAWFDSSYSKPRIEIQTEPNAPWMSVGELSDYPATTARSGTGLMEGASFELSLKKPVRASAVRVIGHPSKSGEAGILMTNCAELEAYGRFTLPMK